MCRYCAVLPAFMNNTIKQSKSATEIFQVSKRLKNGTFFRKRNPEESDPWISISVCVIKTLMTEELITRLGWGPCIFVCSSTVNAAVSTQTQTTPQTCLSSRAVCRHQVEHIVHAAFTFIPSSLSAAQDREEPWLMRKQHVCNQLERTGGILQTSVKLSLAEAAYDTGLSVSASWHGRPGKTMPGG